MIPFSTATWWNGVWISMSGERVALQPAYLLHRRAYRETSLLVEAFTADYGRVGVIAKGAKRGGGRSQGLLQPFQPLLLSWSGRGELHTLTGVESRGAPPLLTGRLLFSGFYLNELLLKLLQREDPHPELFARYGETLATLAEDEEWSLRRFERDLLRELGYGLSLECDAAGEPLEPEALYDYYAEQGPVRVGAPLQGQVDEESPAFHAGEQGRGSSHLLRGSSLLALGGVIDPDHRARQESKRLLRSILAIYLNGRVLESRALYRSAANQGVMDTDIDKEEEEN